MAKQAGMGDGLLIDSFDISGDIGSLNRIGGGPAALDMTDITQSAFERHGGVRDGAMDFTAYFNDATDRAHDTLSWLPTDYRLATYLRGTTLGNPAASMRAKQINYDPTRNQDGSLTIAISLQSDEYGIEWGQQLTAGLRTDTAATNGTSIDYGAVSTLFGLTGYVHVTAFTGTDVTIALEDSANNTDFVAITDAEVEVNGVGYTRFQIGTTATVRRYVRAVTSGTFSSVTFAVNFIRYLTTPGN
jgi:hypothetical protein